jgi:hypothetical protein
MPSRGHCSPHNPSKERPHNLFKETDQRTRQSVMTRLICFNPQRKTQTHRRRPAYARTQGHSSAPEGTLNGVSRQRLLVLSPGLAAAYPHMSKMPCSLRLMAGRLGRLRGRYSLQSSTST